MPYSDLNFEDGLRLSQIEASPCLPRTLTAPTLTEAHVHGAGLAQVPSCAGAAHPVKVRRKLRLRPPTLARAQFAEAWALETEGVVEMAMALDNQQHEAGGDTSGDVSEGESERGRNAAPSVLAMADQTADASKANDGGSGG